MKLYAFQPNGYGQKSFFVMAVSEQEAKAAVDNYLIEEVLKENIAEYNFQGWGTDYYILTVSEPYQVIENGND